MLQLGAAANLNTLRSESEKVALMAPFRNSDALSGGPQKIPTTMGFGLGQLASCTWTVQNIYEALEFSVSIGSTSAQTLGLRVSGTDYRGLQIKFGDRALVVLVQWDKPNENRRRWNRGAGPRSGRKTEHKSAVKVLTRPQRIPD